MSILGVAALGFLGVLGLSAPKAFFSSLPGRGAVAAVVIYLIGETINWIQTERLKHDIRRTDEIKSTNESLSSRLAQREKSLYELIQRQLWLIALRLENDAHDRVSLYKRRPDGSFRLIGRYSQHQEYTEYTRAIIPDHEGIVATVWASQNEESIDIASDPTLDLEAYAVEQQAKCAIPIHTAKAFRMKSRNYRAFAIKDRDGGPSSPGVIVLESTLMGRFSQEVTQRVRVLNVIQEASPQLQLCMTAADESWQQD